MQDFLVALIPEGYLESDRTGTDTSKTRIARNRNFDNRNRIGTANFLPDPPLNLMNDIACN